jgi:molybdopterin converting factor small subunit
MNNGRAHGKFNKKVRLPLTNSRTSSKYFNQILYTIFKYFFIRTWLIKIAIEFSPAFQAAYPLPRLIMELEKGEASVVKLLRRLAEKYGEPMRRLLLEDDDDIKSGLMVMVNERIYTGTALNQQAVELRDNDKVSLLFYISGG